MLDMDRGAITKMVYRKLAQPSFRNRLTAENPDGSRPVHVALREDPATSLIEQVNCSGGACNVVVPALNGFIVLAIKSQRARLTQAFGKTTRLRDDCTVGVLMERLHVDLVSGESTEYTFVISGPGRRKDRGSAEVVAIGG